MNKESIFRKEALEASQSDSTGSTLQSRPLSFAILTTFSLLFAVALLTYAFWGEYTRKEHVSGFLSPTEGTIKVYSLQSGTVRDGFVKEGQWVKRGEKLFVVSAERNGGEQAHGVESATIALMQRSRQSLSSELDKQRDISRMERQELENKIASLENELATINSQTILRKQQVESAHQTVARYQDLYNAKYISQPQVQQQIDLLQEKNIQLQELARSKITLERELGTHKQNIALTQLRSQNEIGVTQRNANELEKQITEVVAKRDFAVMAPTEGQVTSVMVQEGQSANPSLPMLTILPAGSRLEAVLLLPTRAIGFVRPGQQVSLRYQAFPYQRFGSYQGKIVEIARTTLNENDATLPLRVGEPVYRVKVSLDRQDVTAYGANQPLQAGMLLEADIAIDRRRLVDWMLDPLYSVTGKM